jgi:hypothetical protein
MRRKRMTHILKLQRLTSKNLVTEQANLFGSAISTICPLRDDGEPNGFQME